MKILRIKYYKDNVEGGVDFFNKDRDINEVNRIVNEFNDKYSTTSKIELIDVKYILVIDKNNEIGRNCWSDYFTKDEYDDVKKLYNFENEHNEGNNKIIKLITLEKERNRYNEKEL